MSGLLSVCSVFRERGQRPPGGRPLGLGIGRNFDRLVIPQAQKPELPPGHFFFLVHEYPAAQGGAFDDFTGNRCAGQCRADVADALKACERHHLGGTPFNAVKIRVGLFVASNFHKDAAFGDLRRHDVSSFGVLSNFARWIRLSRGAGDVFNARVGKAHRRGSEREGGIIHDGARSGTRERGSECGEAARSCTSGRGTGDAGPAGMMRVYAHPPPLPP